MADFNFQFICDPSLSYQENIQIFYEQIEKSLEKKGHRIKNLKLKIVPVGGTNND